MTTCGLPWTGLRAAQAVAVTRRGVTWAVPGGPLANDTITYSYDELGRVTTRAINGAANTVTWAFDTLGRVTTETNVLGTFTYGYDGPTSRLATVTYPNGQTARTPTTETQAIIASRPSIIAIRTRRRCRGSTIRTTPSATF